MNGFYRLCTEEGRGFVQVWNSADERDYTKTATLISIHTIVYAKEDRRRRVSMVASDRLERERGSDALSGISMYTKGILEVYVYISIYEV